MEVDVQAGTTGSGSSLLRTSQDAGSRALKMGHIDMGVSEYTCGYLVAGDSRLGVGTDSDRGKDSEGGELHLV